MANTPLSSHTNDELAALTGSTFILNNVTYTGADIRVVVHLPNANQQKEERVAAAQTEIKNIENQLKTLTSYISKTRATLSTLPLATASNARLSLKLNSALKRQTLLNSLLITEQQRLTDINKEINAPSTKILSELQTLSISVYRDKQAVRACGSVYPKAFTRGPRQIAGTMIFTVFDEHALYSFLNPHVTDFDAERGDSSSLLDQLPPIDITVTFANEYGSVSRLTILGVEFVDEGQTMSVEDLVTENTVTFVARDIDPMRKVSQRNVDENSRLAAQFTAKRASDLIFENDFQKVKNDNNPFYRFTKRRNPFL